MKYKLNIKTTHVKQWTHPTYTRDVSELIVEMDDMNLSQQQYKHAFSLIFLLEMKDENENNKSERECMFSRYVHCID